MKKKGKLFEARDGELSIVGSCRVGSKKFLIPMNARTRHSIDWGAADQVEMTVKGTYKLFPAPGIALVRLIPDVGKFSFKATWNVSYTDKGIKLDRDGAQPRILTEYHSGKYFHMQVGTALAQSSPGDKKTYVELAITMVGGESDDGVNVGLQFKGLGVSKTVGSSNPSKTIQLLATIELDVKNRPPKKKKPLPPPKIHADILTPQIFTFFKEDQDKFTNGPPKELRRWVVLVNNHEELGPLVAAGKVPVKVDGHASTTGAKNKQKRKKYNMEESKRRKASGERWLKVFFKNNVALEGKGYGDEKALFRGKEGSINRRIDISIDKKKAIDAIKKARAAK